MKQILNQTLLNIVPDTAKTILDLGCGEGLLGEALKKRQDCTVTGIEINTASAKPLAQRLDQVLIGEALEIVPKLENKFDCIILGDVLEHLAHPQQLLIALRGIITTTGHLATCIPNVQHWSIIYGLMKGYWTYQDHGILDKTHLRFYTRQSYEELLLSTGYSVIDQAEIHVRQGNAPDDFILALRGIGICGERFKQQSQVYQYVHLARPMEEWTSPAS